MAPRKKVILRTAFDGDRYVSGDVQIGFDGTELDAGLAEQLVAQARKLGVRLFEVPPEQPETQNERGGA